MEIPEEPKVHTRVTTPIPRRVATAGHEWFFQTSITAFNATVRTAREKSGFKTGLRRRDKSGLERGQGAARHREASIASSPGSPGCCSSWSSLLGRRFPKCHWPTYALRIAPAGDLAVRKWADRLVVNRRGERFKRP
jgi:hypothetical protein